MNAIPVAAVSCRFERRPRDRPEASSSRLTPARFASAEPPLAHERESLGMFDRFHREIDIEVGPVEMSRALKLHIEQRTDQNLEKPRKMLECDKLLPAFHENPESVSRDVRHLNARSGLTKPCGSHPHASERGAARPSRGVPSARDSEQPRSQAPAGSSVPPRHDERGHAAETRSGFGFRDARGPARVAGIAPSRRAPQPAPAAGDHSRGGECGRPAGIERAVPERPAERQAARRPRGRAREKQRDPQHRKHIPAEVSAERDVRQGVRSEPQQQRVTRAAS